MHTHGKHSIFPSLICCSIETNAPKSALYCLKITVCISVATSQRHGGNRRSGNGPQAVTVTTKAVILCCPFTVGVLENTSAYVFRVKRAWNLSALLFLFVRHNRFSGTQSIETSVAESQPSGHLGSWHRV
jgi:hypothetical protein